MAARGRRYRIPKELLRVFEVEPVLFLEPSPGLIPIDIGTLLRNGMLSKLAKSKAFKDKYNVVIMPK
jgi:hypothetical protein